MKRSSTFFTLPGLILTAIFLAGLALFSWNNGGQAFAPGKLSAQVLTGQPLGGYASHQDFEQRCSLCHAPLTTRQDALCLDCHTQVSLQRQTGQGTHSLIDPAEPCYLCHSEHQGRQFDLRLPGLTRFDHERTGFSLAWHRIGYNNQLLGCQVCHAFETDFRLVSQTCQNCHADHDPGFMQQHIADYGSKCQTCHDGKDRMADFKHDQTGFPLLGKHAETGCRACHSPVESGSSPDEEISFSGLAGDCQDCHSEPLAHQGLFSSDCAACHNPQDWQPAQWQGEPFDHEGKVGFSLVHHLQKADGQALTCRDCHLGAIEQAVGPACQDCHAQTDGAAFIQQHLEDFGAACVDCHDGLDRMSDFDHARFFPLDGAHTQIACQDCHVQRIFRGTPSECAQCHAEPEIHAGFFGQHCQDCHTTQAWTPAQLHSHHFPLDHGEQGTVACQTCHPTSYVEYTCYGCHEHQPGETQAKHQEEGISTVELPRCVECHPDGQEDE